MEIKLLTQNSKMKKASLKTYNFGITAYYSEKHKMVTCPNAKDCVALCYARQGTYNFKGVKNAYENRLGITLQDNFSELMINEIKAKKAQVIRIHDSGDFYSREYLQKWLKVIDAFPNVKFYAYTKSYDLFIGQKLPTNFTIIFSEGSKLPLDKNYRHAIVFESIDALKKAGYIDASIDDTNAWNNDSTKIGLVYHGNKKVNNDIFVKG
jgi:hypothetical protein